MSTEANTPAPLKPHRERGMRSAPYATETVAALVKDSGAWGVDTPTSGDSLTKALNMGTLVRPYVNVWGVRAAGAVHA